MAYATEFLKTVTASNLYSEAPKCDMVNSCKKSIRKIKAHNLTKLVNPLNHSLLGNAKTSTKNEAVVILLVLVKLSGCHL